MNMQKPLPGRKAKNSVRKIRCVIVEDQVMFEQMLRTLTEDLGVFEVTGVAHTVAEGIALCVRTNPDLLLLDLALPDGNGLQVVRQLAAANPASRTIVVTAHAGTFRCPANLRETIYSVVEKTSGVEVLLQEILGFHSKARSLDAGIVPIENPTILLSVRELEIFCLIGEGLVSKEIATKLGRSNLTIETHRRNIAAKLNATRGDLIKKATLHNQRERLRESGEKRTNN
jgi:DNA-binding NarL/FixJ family response regulator